jgi:predicted HicB family RNase H-like nuclease
MNVVEHKGYQGSVVYEDGNLVVTILHINDMVSANCDAASEVEAVFAELVDDYLETCKALDKSPDKPFSGTFNIRIGPELHKAAAHAAARYGVSLNSWICTAIREQAESSRPSPQTYHEHIAQLFSLTRQSEASTWHHASHLVSFIRSTDYAEAMDHLWRESWMGRLWREPSLGKTPPELDFTRRKPAAALAEPAGSWKSLAESKRLWKN